VHRRQVTREERNFTNSQNDVGPSTNSNNVKQRQLTIIGKDSIIRLSTPTDNARKESVMNSLVFSMRDGAVHLGNHKLEPMPMIHA
jgi:hypothetical protein